MAQSINIKIAGHPYNISATSAGHEEVIRKAADMLNKMIDTIKQRIKQLIAAYESERMERENLQAAVAKYQEREEAYKKQIIELERQLDNLKLTEAFKASSGNSPEAKKKINNLIKEIDKCISVMEG